MLEIWLSPSSRNRAQMCFLLLPVAALESRTWHPKEFRCYSQEKEKNFNRQIFSLSPNNL